MFTEPTYIFRLLQPFSSCWKLILCFSEGLKLYFLLSNIVESWSRISELLLELYFERIGLKCKIKLPLLIKKSVHLLLQLWKSESQYISWTLTFKKYMSWFNLFSDCQKARKKRFLLEYSSESLFCQKNRAKHINVQWLLKGQATQGTHLKERNSLD